MKWIVPLLLLAANSAYATDVYKCNANGHAVYESSPCPGNTAAKQQPVVASLHTDALPGCYHGKSPGFKDAFEITAGAGGEFNVHFTAGGHEQTMTMRVAKAHDLQAVGLQFHLKLREGISMEWSPNFPHPKPIGVYKGTDENGNEVVFGYFPFGSGAAAQGRCTATPVDVPPQPSQNNEESQN